jgi:hypothetical protein
MDLAHVNARSHQAHDGPTQTARRPPLRRGNPNATATALALYNVWPPVVDHKHPWPEP